MSDANPLIQSKQDRESLDHLQNLLLEYLMNFPKELIALFVDYLRLYVYRFQLVNVLMERVSVQRRNLDENEQVKTIAIHSWKGIRPWNSMMKQSISFKITKTYKQNNLSMWDIGICTIEKPQLLFIQPWIDTDAHFSVDYNYKNSIVQCYTYQQYASQSPFAHLNQLLETFTIEMTLINNHLSYYYRDRENKRSLIVTYAIPAHVFNDDWYPYIQIPENFQVEILDE
jgi:hypothetical protein